jgi:hypothetical protein
MTKIETVTVTIEGFKENRDQYLKVKETKRLVVMRGDEEVAVLGPKLPGEERFLTSEWFQFLNEVFPIGPTDPDDPYSLSRALKETREERTFT